MAFEAQVELATVVSDVDHYHPTTPVDLVLLSYLQVPDEHQRRILRRAAEWLQPGGAVFVVAHDKANVDNGHGGPPDPDVCYTVENTVAALSELRIEVAELAQRPVDGAVALDTVVLAVGTSGAVRGVVSGSRAWSRRVLSFRGLPRSPRCGVGRRRSPHSGSQRPPAGPGRRPAGRTPPSDQQRDHRGGRCQLHRLGRHPRADHVVLEGHPGGQHNQEDEGIGGVAGQENEQGSAAAT